MKIIIILLIDIGKSINKHYFQIKQQYQNDGSCLQCKLQINYARLIIENIFLHS